MLEIGSLVDGKYRILREVGHGGMSIVYLAINEKANKTWAIKEVRKNGVMDFEAVTQGLIVETELLKKLKHPNLPSIIDVIENEDSLLIVMDYIEGKPLSKLLEEYGAQPQELVIKWAKQLCDVLAYLHTREPKIIYRDMKPANIMLKPDSGRDEKDITLIDFGAAREFKEKNLADTMCLGTIGYAAPEQFGGMGQTTERTDIYCLGKTLYHLVTGCNPSEPPYVIRPITEINPNLSTGLEKIIQKCIQDNPDDRYQSCEELMYDLENYKTIDETYRRKQKRKLASFLLTFFMSIVFLAGGFIFDHMAQLNAEDQYDVLMDEAATEVDYDKKARMYEQCIEIPNKEGDKAAYLALITLYKENDESDSVFTKDEAENIVKLVKNNEEELKKDPDGYAEICFEIGKLYWYYYDGDSDMTRRKNSVKWFDYAIDAAGENSDKIQLGMAKVYSRIGTFYTEISVNTIEANDKGKYKPFFDDVNEFIDTVAADQNESEIVRLELLKLAGDAMCAYPTKFKTDGVTQKDMEDMCSRIEKICDSITPTTDRTTELYDDIIQSMDSAQQEISTAFSTKKQTKEDMSDVG